MDCAAFFEHIKDKKIAMCGIGLSHTQLILDFLKSGARVYACDRRTREQIGEAAELIESAGGELRLGEDYLKNLEVDMIFRTPGMSFNLPELIEARKNGIAVTSEMEVFFELCPATIFAVTGSDGKTTTTTLIAEMLKAEGKNVYVGGNIGKPLLPEIKNITADDYVVVELSSFQLISMRKGPDVAVVTNVAPNHLDVHKDMDEYVSAKRNVLLHQNAFSRTVLNRDDEISKGFEQYVRGQFMRFSMSQPVKNGAWYGKDGYLYMAYRGMKVPVMHRDDIALMGDHNIANYLAAMAAVWGYVGTESIKKVAAEFAGVDHRLQLVRELDGVKYYNDSIATSPTRTLAALAAFSEGNVILLAGGYDKHIPFEPMVSEIINKVKTLILTGPTADAIETAVRSNSDYKGIPEIIKSNGLEESVKIAREKAVSGDIVSLSPACASFDAYPNFAARGNHFKELVKNL